ncbi:MAG: hypothetical protein R6U13_08200 [Desulfatiglandaceae bacterium]
MPQTRSRYNRWSEFSIFLVSATVIALQLMLMRALSVTQYHHFSYLVISTALLGFGTSGTFLTLVFDRLKNRFFFWIQLFGLLFVLSIPVTYHAAVALDIDTQYMLYSSRQILLLAAYNAFLFVPFFLGGVIIGFTLSFFKSEVARLYGANLVGSGAGGIGALGLMYLAPAHLLPVIMTPLALLAQIVFVLHAHKQQRRWLSVMFTIPPALIAALSFIFPPPEKVDQYKDLACFMRLERQNDAHHLARLYSPQAQLDLFGSKTFHQALFAGAHATVPPPGQLALLVDGETAGAVFKIDSEQEAGIMDFTPQALPYRLLERPRVLLLGETGGSNVWLARRMNAAHITVVQPNAQIVSLLEDLSDQTGRVFGRKDVEVIVQQPRLFLEQTRREFDLIQFVQAEGMGVGGGLQGLNEEYLLTSESLTRSLEILSDKGLISITRGINSPPRDNIKILSLFIAALENRGIHVPKNHLLISRNYLAVNSLMSRSPLNESLIKRFVQKTRELQMDPEYFPGIISESIQYRNRIDGPAGKPFSYLHHAVKELLSGRRKAFLHNWVYNVQAPSDNRPYFHDFFKWSSVGRYVESFKDQWFRRLELGYVVLFITFMELTLVAFMLILLPLWLKRRRFSASTDRLPAFLHFFSIGIGFMFMEISFIQSFTKFLGHPVISASAVLTAMLVFSGLGSSFQEKRRSPAHKRIKVGGIVIAGLILLYRTFLDPLLGNFIGCSAFLKYIITVSVLFPVSFFLGWMFPAGFQMLERKADPLAPWAWGVNGFASVTAAPLAVIIAMGFGFNAVMLSALICYLVAAGTAWLWNPLNTDIG